MINRGNMGRADKIGLQKRIISHYPKVCYEFCKVRYSASRCAAPKQWHLPTGFLILVVPEGAVSCFKEIRMNKSAVYHAQSLLKGGIHRRLCFKSH